MYQLTGTDIHYLYLTLVFVVYKYLTGTITYSSFGLTLYINSGYNFIGSSVYNANILASAVAGNYSFRIIIIKNSIRVFSGGNTVQHLQCIQVKYSYIICSSITGVALS